MQSCFTRCAMMVTIVALSSLSAVAQPVGNPWQQQMNQQAKQQERQLKQFMALTIDNIDRICKLEEAQKKKLSIAAKGAVERSLGKWKKHMAQMQRQWGGGVGFVANDIAVAQEADVAVELVELAPGEPEPAPDEPEPVDNDGPVAAGDPAGDVPAEEVLVEQVVAPVQVQIQNGMAFNGPMPGFHAPGQTNAVVREAVWTKTLTKVLTKDQQSALRKAEAKRRDLRRKAAVDVVVTMIDSELLLTEEQRPKITELVNKAVGHQFSMQQSGLNQNFSHSNGMLAVQRIPKTQMQKLLSKTQMARWNEFRRQFGAPEQVGPQNGALNWGNILGGFGLE